MLENGACKIINTQKQFPVAKLIPEIVERALSSKPTLKAFSCHISVSDDRDWGCVNSFKGAHKVMCQLRRAFDNARFNVSQTYKFTKKPDVGFSIFTSVNLEAYANHKYSETRASRDFSWGNDLAPSVPYPMEDIERISLAKREHPKLLESLTKVD